MSGDFTRHTGIDWDAGGRTGLARYGDDNQLLVMFYNKPVENIALSQQNGRRFFEDKIYIKIQSPGETLNIIDRPVNDNDKQRFRSQWSAFVQNRTQIPDGTTIDLLFPNHPAIGENLKAYGVYTIEQCANLSASAIDTIGRGAQEYVNKAKRYLSSSEKGRDFHLMQKALEEKDGEIRVLQQQVKQLIERLDKYLMKDNSPQGASLSPGWVKGYDPQTERISANHPTKEIAAKRRGSKNKAPDKVQDKVVDAITDPFANMNNTDIDGTEGQDAIV